jgi:hypothetical protein
VDEAGRGDAESSASAAMAASIMPAYRAGVQRAGIDRAGVADDGQITVPTHAELLESLRVARGSDYRPPHVPARLYERGAVPAGDYGTNGYDRADGAHLHEASSSQPHRDAMSHDGRGGAYAGPDGSGGPPAGAAGPGDPAAGGSTPAGLPGTVPGGSLGAGPVGPTASGSATLNPPGRMLVNEETLDDVPAVPHQRLSPLDRTSHDIDAGQPDDPCNGQPYATSRFGVPPRDVPAWPANGQPPASPPRAAEAATTNGYPAVVNGHPTYGAGSAASAPASTPHNGAAAPHSVPPHVASPQSVPPHVASPQSVPPHVAGPQSVPPYVAGPQSVPPYVAVPHPGVATYGQEQYIPEQPPGLEPYAQDQYGDAPYGRERYEQPRYRPGARPGEPQPIVDPTPTPVAPATRPEPAPGVPASVPAASVPHATHSSHPSAPQAGFDHAGHRGDPNAAPGYVDPLDPSVPVESVEASLPHRVPAPPDVPDVDLADLDDEDEGPAPPDVDGGSLTRIASGLRTDARSAIPDELDVNAVLAAVRHVDGVREAVLRGDPGGVQTLRLELADGADPGRVSRQVARLLKERMGIAAQPRRSERSELDSTQRAAMPRAGSMPPPSFTPLQPGAPGSPVQPDAPYERPGSPYHPSGLGHGGHGVVNHKPPHRPQPGQPAAGQASSGYAGVQPPVTDAAARAAAPAPQPNRPASLSDAPAPSPHPVGPPFGMPRTSPSSRAILDRVKVATVGTEATVEVRLSASTGTYVGSATGPAVDAYLLRLAAQAAAGAIDSLMARRSAAPVRCFIDHAGVVPFGSCLVAIVVVLVSGDGWVEQLVGSALVAGDPRQAIVRATLAAVNRRLDSLLG